MIKTTEEIQKEKDDAARKFHLAINGHVFDRGQFLDYQETHFDYLAGNWPVQERVFLGGPMTYPEYLARHEKDHRTSFKGRLTLTNVNTGQVLRAINI